jgi:hypothetical protein
MGQPILRSNLLFFDRGESSGLTPGYSRHPPTISPGSAALDELSLILQNLEGELCYGITSAPDL